VIKTVEDIKELQAKGLLDEAQVMLYTELVNNGVTIPILETTNRKLENFVSENFLKYSIQNKGKAKIGPDGELIDYAGQGLPFPDISPDDPQAGIKAAWNFEYRHMGDTTENFWSYWLVDSKRNVKTLKGIYRHLSFANRTDMPPMPYLHKGNPGGIRYKETTGFTAPFSSKGLVQLAVKYEDPMRERDIWIYVPGLRRVTRVGAGNRCDCLGGFVHNMDDQLYFSGTVTKFTWKFMGTKELLVGTLYPRDRDWPFLRLHGLPVKLERRKVWIIEQRPKDADYCYSKRIYYMDPENWVFVGQDNYDRAGKLWKYIGIYYSVFPNPAGGGYCTGMDADDVVDFKIWEAGPMNSGMKKNIDLKPDQFTLDYLRRSGR